MSERARPQDYPGAAPWLPNQPSLGRLRAAVQNCRGCDLYRDTTQAVMGDGPRNARLLLLGEQPGDKEDIAGQPFVGPAGRLLDKALVAAGLDPDAAFRTNVVKHFRHETTSTGKRIHKSPVRWQVAACEPWLLAELDLVRPELVVVLGATAGQAVFGSTFRVGASRGHRLDWPSEYRSVEPAPMALATVHPSSVLRSRQREADFAAFVADLTVAHQLLG